MRRPPQVFLPQLLAYPNPMDPLNSEAASLLLRDKEAYAAKVPRRGCGAAPWNTRSQTPRPRGGVDGGRFDWGKYTRLDAQRDWSALRLR